MDALHKKISGLIFFLGLMLVLGQSARAQSGHLLTAAGPVNQGMGGVSTGLLGDAIGSIYWNPASISQLKRTEIGFGLEIFIADRSVESSVAANAFGPGVPAVGLAGKTKSEVGVSPIPTLGFVLKKPDSKWTFGLGAYGVGGFGVDYPANPANPITMAPPPNGFGFGSIYTNFQLLQITPVVSYQINDNVSFGIGPNVDWALLSILPFLVAAPDDADGDTFPHYPNGSQAATAFGTGLQAGLFFVLNEQLSGGISIKSPQWFEKFKFNSVDELGAPRRLSFKMDVPMVVSAGVGYKFDEALRAGVDVRYIDYEHTDGFEASAYRADGSVTGFGWKSIWVVAVGTEFKPQDVLAIRAGYSWNQSPIEDSNIFFNTPAPGIIEHHAYVGFSIEVADGTTLSVAYHHGFQNSARGPWLTQPAPATPGVAPIPGTSTKSTLETNSASFGLSVSL